MMPLRSPAPVLLGSFRGSFTSRTSSPSREIGRGSHNLEWQDGRSESEHLPASRTCGPLLLPKLPCLNPNLPPEPTPEKRKTVLRDQTPFQDWLSLNPLQHHFAAKLLPNTATNIAESLIAEHMRKLNPYDDSGAVSIIRKSWGLQSRLHPTDASWISAAYCL